MMERDERRMLESGLADHGVWMGTVSDGKNQRIYVRGRMMPMILSPTVALKWLERLDGDTGRGCRRIRWPAALAAGMAMGIMLGRIL